MVKKKDAKKTADEIFSKFGGTSNIVSYTHCVTRLRIVIKDENKINPEAIKTIENVQGLMISNDEYQVILGVGFVQRVFSDFQQLFKNDNDIVEEYEDLNVIAAKNKADRKAKNTSSIQKFIAKFSKIFAPLIFGFIGAGMLSGIGSILQSFYYSDGNWTNITAQSIYTVFNVMLNLWKDVFVVIVGWRTAEIFGGKGVIGAIGATMFVPHFAALYDAPFIPVDNGFNFLGIKILNPETNWLTIGLYHFDSATKTDILSYATGAIFGAMMMAWISIPIEKFFAKYIPDVFYSVLVTTVTFFVMLFFGYFLIIPISGILFNIVAFAFSHLQNNAFGCAFLAGIFLVAVVFGVHQGFIPVYMSLIDKYNVNALYSVLAMAGAAQVGASLALYFKTDDKVLKNQIRGAIIPGFFGIGEPLIYGVTITRPKIFISAMFGAAISGFFLGAFAQWGHTIVGLNTVYGPSGLLSIPMIVGKKYLSNQSINRLLAISLYVGAWAISVISGFIISYFIGTRGMKNESKQQEFKQAKLLTK